MVASISRSTDRDWTTCFLEHLFPVLINLLRPSFIAAHYRDVPQFLPAPLIEHRKVTIGFTHCAQKLIEFCVYCLGVAM